MKLSQIFEYNRDATARNWGQKLLTAANKDKSYRDIHQLRAEKVDERYLPDILQRLESADPTKNKEYTQWLAKVYSTGSVKIEDIISRGADALIKYAYAKRKNLLKPEHKDIGRLSFKDVEDIAMQVPQEQEKNQQPQNAVQYYKDNDLRIIIPRDEQAACYYGQGTKWCTAARQNNMFKYYSEKGPLYIVIPLKPEYPGEKYQFNFETSQFMNEKDEPADLMSLVKQYPQLQKIFAKEGNQFSILPLIVPLDKLIQMWDQAVDHVEYRVHEKLSNRKYQDQIKNAIIKDLRRYNKKYTGPDWMDTEEDLLFLFKDLFDARPLVRLISGVTDFLKKSDFSTFNDEDSLEDSLTNEIIPEWLNSGAPGLVGDIADLFDIDEEGDEMYDVYHEIVYTLGDIVKQLTREIMKEILKNINNAK